MKLYFVHVVLSYILYYIMIFVHGCLLVVFCFLATKPGHINRLHFIAFMSTNCNDDVCKCEYK